MNDVCLRTGGCVIALLRLTSAQSILGAGRRSN
jgi:hypothetical protein